MNLSIQEKELLCLALIVKNAEETIISTLKAAWDYIDYYTIIDTGSTDNTISLFNQFLEMSPKNGYLETHLFDNSLQNGSFFNFKEARNYTLDIVQANSNCEWVLFIDDTYQLNGGDLLRKTLKNIPNSINALTMVLDAKETIYIGCRLTRVSRGLRYKYKIHEIIDTQGESAPKLDSKIFLFDNITTKMDQRSRDRYLTDLQVLLLEYTEAPTDARILFYLGQVYGMLKDFENCIKYYTLRTNNTDYPFKYNGYSENEPKDEELFISLCNMASVYEFEIKDWSKAMEYYLKAFSYAPYRSEPLFQIAVHYYLASENSIAYTFLQRAIQLKLPVNDTLFVERIIYQVKIPHLLACVAFRLREFAIAKKAAEQCLQFDPKNTEVLTIIKNINLMSTQTTPTQIVDKSKYRASLTKRIVINTGYNFDSWSPLDIDRSGLGGSETSAVLMGVEFAKMGYETILFSNFRESQFVFNGLKCLDIETYPEYIQQNWIDVLIVSRFSQFIYYGENVEQVYLWLHDCSIPTDTLKIEPSKFRKLICISNWQRDQFCAEFNFPRQMTYLTSNSIITERFKNKEIEKVKNRFIFSSTPSRGLNHLLDMWGDILQIYPDSTLHLFCDFEHRTMRDRPDIQQCLRLMDIYTNSVFSHGRISQKQLAIEFLKSEYWFYPSEFWETYCITALEAQAARTFCLCTTLAALPETVGDRGILLDGEPGTQEYKAHALQNLFFIMGNDEVRNQILDKAEAWAMKKEYSLVAREWVNDLFKFPSEPKIQEIQLIKVSKSGFVINLDRRPDRLNSFGERLTNAFNLGSDMHIERVSAIDWLNISDTPEFFKDNDFKSNKGVIGCAMSHIKVWNTILNNNLQFSIVFEDDCSFVESFERQFNDAFKELPEDWDLLYIGGPPSNLSEINGEPFTKHLFKPNKDILVKNKGCMSTVCYAISKKGAKRLLDIIHSKGMKTAIDWFLIDQWETLSVFSCKNLCYQNNFNDSDIRSSEGYNQIWD